ncbi:hypothetical protein QTP70_027544, partial [Hemibagrus guttatus]
PRKNQRYMMAEKVTEIEEATERSQALKTRSIASASTNRSRSSSASIVAAKTCAKLEAVRAKAEFLKKESEILIEKARLKVTEACMEASLSALKHESEVAAALAEAKVLEAAAESELGERISDVREISDRTHDYVMCQSQVELSPPVGDEPYQSPLEPIVHMLKPETPQRRHRFIAWDVRDSYNKPDTESIMQQPQRSVQTPSHKFQAPPFNFSPYKTTPQPSFNNDANVSEIARIDSFPKISNKDAKKLRELRDLLQEVESAKRKGYNIFDRDHDEMAPPLREGQECWYLPIFGVYHPQKPGQIRVVFDSSVQKQGISLNDVLLSGPDLNNSLLGVLLRFRRELVAVTADIEQMFHSFIVKEEDRDFLHFLWFKENDTRKEIIEYCMRAHVFGNSPSPAVAIYGLRQAAAYDEKEYGSDAKHFVEREFYVDDGLLSTPTAAEAIDLLTRTKEMLATLNLRLHKFASNSKEVMDAFPIKDHAKGLKDLNLEVDPTPIQCSLGLSSDVKRDVFTFHVTNIKKPFTRRGILATVNSLFGPIGFVAPSSLKGNSYYENSQVRLLTGTLLSLKIRKKHGMHGENPYKISNGWKFPDRMSILPSLQL